MIIMNVCKDLEQGIDWTAAKYYSDRERMRKITHRKNCQDNH